MSADGHDCGVSVQVDDHPREVRPYALGQIARVWHVSRKDLAHIFENWTPERLIEHLGQFTKADLMPPRARR